MFHPVVELWVMMMMLMIFNTKILLRRRWRIGFFRGWFILDISGFPHSKPDSAASLKPRRNYEVFFLCIRSSSACTLLYIISAGF